MTATVESVAATPSQGGPRRVVVISALGVTQILAWGSSYYLLAVLANPIAETTGWPLAWVIGGLSVGLFVAGLVSPRVGRAIERWGGRPVLAASAMLFAVGLAGMSFSTSVPLYVLSWLVIGFAMGAGLYDAAFAMLGRLYGQAARSAITTLTLWGGFASTVCWPLTAFLVESVGWRGTCLVYAALHLVLVLPLFLFALPREEERAVRPGAAPAVVKTTVVETSDVQPRRGTRPAKEALVFALLAAAVTISAMIMSVVSVHLLTILQARDIALAAAVGLGALIGPAQVGARVIEMVIGRHYHPIWTMVAAVVLVAAGIGILFVGLPAVAVGLIIYGAGNGIYSIARGTLPLALFGPSGYASRIGRLAMPAMIAQAISPTLAAVLLEQFGASATLALLTALAVANIGVVAILWQCSRSRTAEQ